MRILIVFLWVYQLGCASANSNEFNAFYEALTYPSKEWNEKDFGNLPNKELSSLLAAHAPTLYVGKNTCAPMDFYRQYLPKLTLNGSPVSRESLKADERSFDSELELKDTSDCIQSPAPPLYAYAWKENMDLGNGKSMPIKVLKYNHVFFKSGLPKKQSFPQNLSLLLGDQDLWHYLDIHGGIFYLLDTNNKPFALVLAQHNHFRSYIIGKDITEHQAKKICYSLRSNEPYVCPEAYDNTMEPTAANFKHMRWIVTGNDRPFLGAEDIVPGFAERQILNSQLEILPNRDPLIVSWRELGPNIKIWGLFSTFYRDSPPGMAIFNHPDLKDIWKTAHYFYFDPSDEDTFKLHELNMKSFFEMNVTPVLNRNGHRFLKTLFKEEI